MNGNEAIMHIESTRIFLDFSTFFVGVREARKKCAVLLIFYVSGKHLIFPLSTPPTPRPNDDEIA